MSIESIISNKIAKREESFQIYTYENGFMIEIPGRDKDDNWVTAKVLASSFPEMQSVVEYVVNTIPVL